MTILNTIQATSKIVSYKRQFSKFLCLLSFSAFLLTVAAPTLPLGEGSAFSNNHFITKVFAEGDGDSGSVGGDGDPGGIGLGGPNDVVTDVVFENAPTSFWVAATSPSGVQVFYLPPTATQFFNYSEAGNPLVSCNPPSGSIFQVGDTVVTCSATDIYTGQDVVTSFTISVLPFQNSSGTTTDTLPPVITLNGSSTMSLVVGSTFTDPGATALDLVDGDRTPFIIATGTVDTLTVGTYTISYSVSDLSGNTATTSRDVIITASSTGGGGTGTTTGGSSSGGVITISGGGYFVGSPAQSYTYALNVGQNVQNSNPLVIWYTTLPLSATTTKVLFTKKSSTLVATTTLVKKQVTKPRGVLAPLVHTLKVKPVAWAVNLEKKISTRLIEGASLVKQSLSSFISGVVGKW
jgi:hypothetical protein